MKPLFSSEAKSPPSFYSFFLFQVAHIKCIAMIEQDQVNFQARPILILGEGKGGRRMEGEGLIWKLTEEVVVPRMAHLGYKYCGTSSDGDGPRQAFEVCRTCLEEVVAGHPLFAAFSKMEGITMRIGIGGTTRSGNKRHGFKCGRAAFATDKGITVGDICAHPAVVLQHARHAEPTADPASFGAMIFPPDAMTVSYAVALIQTLHHLPSFTSPEVANEDPTFVRQRAMLNFASRPLWLFLRPFIESNLDLSEALKAEAQGAWLVWAWYRRNPTRGLPAQSVQNWLTTTYATHVEILHMKNIVEQTGVPLKFWLVLVGENELEALFAAIKLAGGNDVLLSLETFARRAGKGVLMNELFNRFPQFRRGQKQHRNVSTVSSPTLIPVLNLLLYPAHPSEYTSPTEPTTLPLLISMGTWM